MWVQKRTVVVLRNKMVTNLVFVIVLTIYNIYHKREIEIIGLDFKLGLFLLILLLLNFT